MGTNSIFAFIAFACGFLCVFFLTSNLLKHSQKYLLNMKAQKRILPQDSLWSSVVRNGVVWFKPLSRFLLKRKKIADNVGAAQLFFEQKGLTTTAENICSLSLALALGIMVVFLFIGRSFIFAFVGVFCLIFLVMAYFSREKEKRNIAIREAIPDALRSMSVCFNAGFTLSQTFSQVANELDEPLKGLFEKAVSELEVGGTVSEALAVFKNSSINELAFIAVALDVQHKLGGSMQQVLDVTRESVESEIELKRSLKVQTAQAKMSAHVVSIMPFILVAVFSLITEDFLAPFFQSVLGLCLLAIAIMMQLGGILLVRKTLNIEVG